MCKSVWHACHVCDTDLLTSFRSKMSTIYFYGCRIPAGIHAWPSEKLLGGTLHSLHVEALSRKPLLEAISEFKTSCRLLGAESWHRLWFLQQYGLLLTVGSTFMFGLYKVMMNQQTDKSGKVTNWDSHRSDALCITQMRGQSRLATQLIDIKECCLLISPCTWSDNRTKIAYFGQCWDHVCNYLGSLRAACGIMCVKTTKLELWHQDVVIYIKC